jgi:hypothetical protein
MESWVDLENLENVVSLNKRLLCKHKVYHFYL